MVTTHVPILFAALSGFALLQIGHSSKGVEQRLEKLLAATEKLIKPGWHFWLPVAISILALAVSGLAVIVAFLAWQQPCPTAALQSDSYCNALNPSKVTATPNKHTANPSITTEIISPSLLTMQGLSVRMQVKVYKQLTKEKAA